MENKECKKCKNLLPLDSYYVSNTGLIGRICKKCLSSVSKERRAPDVEVRKLQKKLEIEKEYQEKINKLKEIGDGIPRKEEILTKKCIKCGQILALNQFRKHGKADDAYQNACKKCYVEKREQVFIKHNTERFRTHKYGENGKICELSCNRCKEILPFSSFSIRKYGEDGEDDKYISTCKDCCRKAEIQRKRQTINDILTI